jgi:low affinity Fe/Cu permease
VSTSMSRRPFLLRVNAAFAGFAARCAIATGSFWAFICAFLSIIIWALLGPSFGYSGQWQLVINTGTTIVTFLMVFVIQHAQNKDMRAVQLKLNEIIAATEGASNRLIDVEDLTEEELERIYQRFRHLVANPNHTAVGAKTTVESEPDLVPRKHSVDANTRPMSQPTSADALAKKSKKRSG